MLETQGVWETSATLGSPLTTAGLPEATQKHLSILRLTYCRLATSNVGRREKVCVFMRLVGVLWKGVGMESEYPICYSSSRSHAAFPFSSEAACPLPLSHLRAPLKTTLLLCSVLTMQPSTKMIMKAIFDVGTAGTVVTCKGP